jgi:hypothetical protein
MNADHALSELAQGALATERPPVHPSSACSRSAFRA